jgi:DNA-binding NarL/FixJ family response regulator
VIFGTSEDFSFDRPEVKVARAVDGLVIRSFFAVGRRIFRPKYLARSAFGPKLNPTMTKEGCVDRQAQENRIRLLLLDDQALLRASLAHLLATEPDLDVVGAAGDTAEALEILSGAQVDVVLLDFGHATEQGGFISLAGRGGFQGGFLIIAGEADPQSTASALRLGSSGIFLKSEAPHRLVQAIRVVANGGVWLDPHTIQMLADRYAATVPQLGDESSAIPLNEREQKVLSGILGGLTNKKIGQNLGISEGSVKTSIQQLFFRTGVRTRGQLVRVALESSWCVAKTARHAAEDSDAPAWPDR